MRKTASFAMILISALSLVGCASYKSGVIQSRSANQFVNALESSGVVVGAEAVTDGAKVRQIFYLNITEKSYYPVEVSIHNGGQNRVLVPREEIELLTAGGTGYKPVNVSAMVDDIEKNKMAYALLGFGIFSYASADDANKKMATDWSSKELPNDVIVDAGRETSGFIYFKLPNGTRPNGMVLQVPAENLEMRTNSVLKLQL